MVEDEDGWTMRPEMFFSLDAKIDSSKRGCEISPDGTGDVEGLAV